jgi:hypothetical protein
MLYLQHNWDDDGEAQDIIDYCRENGIKIELMTGMDLMDMDSHKFLSNMYFCDTDIVQYHLSKTNKTFLVPDTYEKTYEKLYDRKIEKMTLSEYFSKYDGIERFIKPFKNNKEFDGFIIKGVNDFTDRCVPVPSDTTEIYTCEPLVILSEVRLLIGNHKLYGHTHMCKNRIDTYLKDTKLISDLLELTGTNYRCIDIGLVRRPNLKWIVMEINPPFSLDSYEIPISDYMAFCMDVCVSISAHFK